MVPNGWVKIRLGSVAELQRGFDLPNSERVEGCVPIVSSGGLTGYHSKAKAKAPGVVTGRYGSIGDVFYLEEDYWPLNTSLWVKNFHGNHEKFIYYLLCNFDFKKFSDKTGVPGVNRNDLHTVKVRLPPIPEQKKIAQILSIWDKAITSTEKLLANSQQQKKALMQKLLTGKKRLLNKQGIRFDGEWKLAPLAKLFHRVTTKNDGQSTNVVTISGQHGLIRQEDFFKKTVASETLDNYFLLKEGQFAYNKSYSNGYPMGAIKRLNRYFDGVVTTLYICFELAEVDKAESDFWEHYFESGLLNKGLSQVAHEGGRAHGLLNVKPSDFFSLKVPVPSFEEQQKIATVLSTADQEITNLKEKLAALKQEKKAMMQQLLTGKRRVKFDNKEVA